MKHVIRTTVLSTMLLGLAFAVPAQIPEGDTPETMTGVTYNMDFRGLIQRMDSYLVEIDRSQSGNMNSISEADVARFNSYVADMSAAITRMQAPTNPLDLPKFHPTMMELDALPDLNGTSNPWINELGRSLAIFRSEAALMDSNMKSSGIDAADAERLTSYLTRLSSVISDAEAAPVLDVNESFPGRASVEAGQRGIAPPPDGSQIVVP